MHTDITQCTINDKERILKAAREKKVTCKGKPIRLSSDVSAETLHARKEWEPIIQITVREKLPAKNISSKVIGRRNKDFSRHTEAEGIYHQNTSTARILKGVILPKMKNKRSQHCK